MSPALLLGHMFDLAPEPTVAKELKTYIDEFVKAYGNYTGYFQPRHMVHRRLSLLSILQVDDSPKIEVRVRWPLWQGVNSPRLCKARQCTHKNPEC